MSVVSAAISLRRADPADVEALSHFAARTFARSAEGLLPIEDLADYVVNWFSPGTLDADLHDPTTTILVAEAPSREILGYVRLHPTSPPPIVAACDPIELSRLYAAPHWIGCGVGSTLMDQAIEVAEDHGHDVMWLQVHPGNDRAIAFYERWGFERLGATTFEAGETLEAALVMGRTGLPNSASTP